jgi:L-aminopeptidase/D-esterase-like protein
LIAITNTHSVGVVRDAIIQWEVAHKKALQPWWLPVVAETYDGGLNDINGFHVKPQHVVAALDGASGGVPKEGAVGGGTGMVCHGFKGGIGTASRKLTTDQGGYTVGVLVQCNYGSRRDLRIAGVPVGERLRTAAVSPTTSRSPPAHRALAATSVAATAPSTTAVTRLDHRRGRDRCAAPPHQLKRLATACRSASAVRVAGGNSSGDIFIAFSTANPRAWFNDQSVTDVKMLPNDRITPLFKRRRRRRKRRLITPCSPPTR